MIESPNPTVKASVDGGVCTITLNRPDALNALDRDMAAALVAVTRAAEADDGVRAVLIRGAGEHFMAGGDIKTFSNWLAELPDRSQRRDRFESFIHEVHPCILAITAMPKPVLAAVRGAVAGFGMSLMMACDMALAAEDSVFTLAYCHIGTSPDGSSTYMLPRAVGSKRAFEIACLGERFGADEARQIGLINRVVESSGLDAEAGGLAARLAAGPTLAYAKTKALLNASPHRGLENQLAAEAAAFGECAAGEDFAEGLAAFLAKRAARFIGR